MKLTLVNQHSKTVHHIVWLDITTPVGNFVIQHGHAPAVMTLKPGTTLYYCLKNGKTESLNARQGIVEIQREEVTVILNEEATRV